MPVGAACGIAPHAVDHRRLQRRRAAELQPQVAGEPGRGHHVHLLADAHRVGRHDQVHRRLARRRRRRALQQTPEPRDSASRRSAAPVAATSTTSGPASDRVASLDRAGRAELPAARPHRAEPELEHGRAGRVRRRSRLRCARCARRSRSPLNGASVTCIGSGEWLTARSGVDQLLAHRDPVLVHRRRRAAGGRPAAQHQRQRGRAAVTSPSLRRRAALQPALLLRAGLPLPPLHRVEDLLGLALAEIPGLAAAGGCGLRRCWRRRRSAAACRRLRHRRGGGGGAGARPARDSIWPGPTRAAAAAPARSRSAASSEQLVRLAVSAARREQAGQAQVVQRAVPQLGIERLGGLGQRAARDFEPAGLAAPRCPRCRTRCPGRVPLPASFRNAAAAPAGSPAASARSPAVGRCASSGPDEQQQPARPTSAGPGRAMV